MMTSKFHPFLHVTSGSTAWKFAVLLACVASASSQTTTGPQQLAFAGLRSVANQGQFNAIKADASGNLFLLLDQKDGVRILKTDPTATTLLAQSQLGAAGDIGLSLALDPAGNVYVAGTTTSTTLTGTAGTAFPNRADTSTNSFIAKYDASLNNLFVTFAGSGRLAATSVAATADAVFLTGSLFAATLPATTTAYQQTPASGSSQHGFVERFSADGSTLVYATYLTGTSGDTSPAAIAADSSDNAYIAGYTTAPGFPTLAALAPVIQTPAANSTPSSGFLAKLTPAGDALLFSTFIPGSGVTSLALDPTANNLILSGSIALGAFPVATVQSPIVATQYQVFERIARDGSSVLSSALLAPGTQSFLTPAPNGAAWADGAFSTPLLPATPLASLGTSYAARITAQGTIDQTARFGGLASTSPANASAPVTLTSLATDADGNPFLAGAFTPTASSTLLATQRYDLPLANASAAILPSSIIDTALPAGSCSGSLCSGSAAYLAKLTTGTSAPSLAFSIGASPDILLRNLGSGPATGLQLTAIGFSLATTCAATLDPGAECSIALTASGSGSGTLAAQSTNAPTQTVSLPGATTTATAIVFFPRELDFGIQTQTSAPILRTITITNLSQQTQTFTSTLDALTGRNTPTSPFTESSSDCPSPTVLTTKSLAAGATCHITLAFSLTSTTADGPLQAFWKIATAGSHDVLLSAYANSAALNTSVSTIDFGTQYAGGLRSPRFLYLSNNSDTTIQHTPAAISSPFTLTDRCPTTLLPRTVCQIQFAYESPTTPAVDAVTLPLDQGLSVLVTGRTLPQPLGPIGTTNPNLTVTPTTVTFANAVPVTSQSAGTQTVSIANTGASDLPLALTLTGDFTDATSCTATLAAHQTCNVVLTFAPTAPGTRTGLLTVASGSSNNPIYVGLNGTATPILTDGTGNVIQGTPTINFGSLSITQPTTQWFKVSQPFQSFTATATGAFNVILVEDIGFGHGSPAPSAYQPTATGTCTNCFLGVQFKPTATGPQTGSLSLTSATFTNAYILPLTGTGLPLTGLLVAPATQDLGMVPVNSTSQPFLFTLTNLLTTNTAVTLTAPTITGDFAISSAPTGGTSCTGSLAPAATCFVQIAFSPTVTGPRTGTLTFPTSSGNITASVTGTGQADPGISLSPNALTFQPLPGPTATQQTIIVANTGSANLQIGSLTTTNTAFAPTTTCTTLAPTATCTVTVAFTPTTVQTSATLQIPVTTAASGTQTLTTYTVPLTGADTATTGSLQILPAQTNFGPTPVDTVGPTRTFTINNLTAQPQTLTLNLPRQFALTTPNPCPTLAANASCTFNVTSLPLTTADITGTIYAQANTTGGTPTSTVAYLQSYGTNSTATALRVTGSLSPGTGFFDFGQIPSGQTRTQILTLTNISTTAQTLTLRRITSQPPFLSTTTCGPTLTQAQSCTVSVTYSPINQVATGSASSPAIANTGTLTIESDDASSPTIIDLTGSAAPVAVTVPGNVSPVATYTLSQSSLTFPNTAVGNISPTQTITVTNTGTNTLHLGTLTTTPDFAITNNCTQPFIAGATCTLTLSFTPTALGVRTSALQIASDSGTSLDFLTLLGVSYPSSLLITPQSIDFGSLLVGATATQPVQITNNGQVPVTISSLTVNGDYAVTSICPATLAPAATCTAQVTFTPTTPGTRPGTLSVTNSASALPLTTSLTGIGLQSHLTANPVLAAFGNVGVGSSLNLTITLTNTGTATLNSLALAITGDYTIATPCPTATLAPTQTCQVTLTFTPSAIGSRPGTLTITSTDSTSPLQIPLTGTGIQSHLQIAPTTLAFGTVALGSTATLPLALTNTGTANITALAPTIAGDYTIATPCSTTTLAPNQSCTLTILFTPTALGLRGGTLILTDSDQSSPTSIPLTGTGTTTPSHLQVTPTALTFGSITVGSSANLSLTVSNTGTTPITTIALAITGDYAVTTPCPSSLPAAQSCSINIAFTPTATGVRTGILTLTSSDPSSPVPISLTGTGAAAATPPHLQIAPATLSFGTVTLGTSSTLTATLSNPGSTPITTIGLAISGDYTQTSTCTATLPAAQSCTISVTFSPTTLGARTGNLTITSSDSASPTTVPLTGNASAATSHLQITPTTPTFGSVTIGSSASLTVTLANTSLTTINSIALTTTGDYTLTSACASLAPAQTCAAIITFAPTALGTRTGTLTITSSDPASPLSFPLTGTGTPTPTSPGSFTLTVNGASTASATIASGSTATYNLTVTPTGGFTGPVVLNCTPLTSATYSSCAMLPSTVTLAGSAQSATLTITTLTSLASPQPVSTLSRNPTSRIFLGILTPACLLFFRRRRTRRSLPLLFAWTLLFAATISTTGCGGGPNLTLRYVTPGTYQYQVTASSTATVPITQTVTVTLVITNN